MPHAKNTNRRDRESMTFEELETYILALDLPEQAELLQLLTQALSNGAQGITKTPGVMEGDACIANTHLPIWLFVRLRRQGLTDAELLSAYPDLTAADLVNIWAYAYAHLDEIEAALERHDVA